MLLIYFSGGTEIESEAGGIVGVCANLRPSHFVNHGALVLSLMSADTGHERWFVL